MTTDYPKRENKYRKTTNEMGRRFPGGRNRPRSLSLLDDDDYYSLNFTFMQIHT